MTEQVHNIGELKLTYKTKVPHKDRPFVKDSKDCYDQIVKLFHENDIEYKEMFGILLLNRAHRVIGYQWISQGSDTGTVVSIKFIAQAAVLGNASAVVLFHNRPSGNTNPSNADITLSKQAKQGLKLLDIDVIDSLIICLKDYYSLADNSLV